MGDLALYRKYRSRSFAEVVGQEHIVTTLANALRQDRVSHAYLFTGPRGVGKTTVARLLARAVNCQGAGKDKPCNQCADCQLDLNSQLDIIEIDAASNRRIDEIRDLRDKISIAPARGRYKVYIIDEVHMLTPEAFNALLKTLEEPPAHAIFVLATTEAHKLPPTIVSRTQHFSFLPIREADIQRQLAAIAKQEKIAINPEALAVLAAAARGSFRDAISLLDQTANLGSQPIDAEAVRRLLGWSTSEEIAALAQSLLDQDPAAVLTGLDQLIAQGTAPGQITYQLIQHFRDALRRQVREPAQQTLTTARLSEIIESLLQIHKAPLPQLALEATLVRLTASPAAALSVAPKQPVLAPRAAEEQPPEPEAESVSPGPGPVSFWDKALKIIKEHNNNLYAVLRTCSLRLEDDSLTIVCSLNFYRQRLEEPKYRALIEKAVAAAAGKPLKVMIKQEAAAASASPSAELVSTAVEILGGEVVDG